MNTRCPKCGSSGPRVMEICYPTWFKFDQVEGYLDATTITTVDAEAHPTVLCSVCSSTWTNVKNLEEFSVANVPVPPLDQWVEFHAKDLQDDVRCHVQNMTTAEDGDLEDVVRCIMTSVRDRLEGKI